MGMALHEQEIFACLSDDLKSAADHCDQMAVSPQKGPIWRELRDELNRIEGCCRQAAAYREDARWLQHGLTIGKASQLALNWLIGVRVNPGDALRTKLAAKHSHWCFSALAVNLRGLLAICVDLRDQRTGRIGMIVPKPLELPELRHRAQRVVLPAGMVHRPSGLLVPSGEP